jgi:methylamine---glutamate N-methyltransferase subunit A
MCGIVGLMIRNPALQSQLGEWAQPMLIGMTERGPDSAGIAVFTAPLADGLRKLSLQAPDGFDWDTLRATLADGESLAVRANHGVLVSPAEPAVLRTRLRSAFPALHVLSTGRAIDLYKDVGTPAQIADRYGLAGFTGTHLVAHTRMATESAVTPENAHPYTAGEDWCLVHNGSLSNPYSLRRKLEPLGIAFDGDCDTEAACRWLEWRMREGDTLEQALTRGFDALDGFYTFLMGTSDALAIVRDGFACKPALVAETDDWVAIASEYRSLAHLPGVASAKLYEPQPERIYAWRAAA